MPCVAYNETEDSLVLLHGDEFLAEGHDSSLDKLDDVLGCVRGLSACRALIPQLVVGVCLMHRTIRWNESGFSCRPDHLNTCTRWVRLCRWKTQDLLCNTIHTGHWKGTGQQSVRVEHIEKAIYMSGSGLLQYIALDRMDVVFATKEVTSRAAKADVLALLLLNRVERCLVGHREVATNHPYQDNPSQIDFYTDADWAGDVAARLSTTAGALMHGAHWLEGWSATQKVRASSSGEAEFYAQGSGAARGMLMEHICHEAGEPKKTLVLHCGSVASRSMAQRLGAGMCRHIEVELLWLQQSADEKKLAAKHVPTESNIADRETKGLTSDRKWKLMNQMGMSLVAGVECLVQPMEKITGTSILAGDRSSTVGGCGTVVCEYCSDDTIGTLLREISRVINCDNVEMLWNGQCRSDLLSCSSMSCGASGRGGVLGIELITTTYGTVYNGINDDTRQA